MECLGCVGGWDVLLCVHRWVFFAFVSDWRVVKDWPRTRRKTIMAAIKRWGILRRHIRTIPVQLQRLWNWFVDVGVVDRGRCIMVDTSCHFFYSDCNKRTTLIEKTLRQSTPKGVYNGLTRAFSRGINTDCVITLKHSTLVHADWPFLSRGSVGVGCLSAPSVCL